FFCIYYVFLFFFFFFSSRRRHTRSKRDWSSDVCSFRSHLAPVLVVSILSIAPVVREPFSLWANTTGSQPRCPKPRGPVLARDKIDRPWVRFTVAHATR